MASSIRIHNGKGARRAGHVARTRNEGHAADSLGFYAGPNGYVTLEVGDQVCAPTRAAKSAVNSGLNAAGWLAHTLHDVREHPTGAVIEIERHVWVDGVKMTAVYTRTS